LIHYYFRLLQYPIAENRTGPQTVDLLIKRIGALGASQSGQFLVDCETYSSAPTMGGEYKETKFIGYLLTFVLP